MKSLLKKYENYTVSPVIHRLPRGYCRQIDWKYYMNNVFNELQKKVLGEEEFIEGFYKRCFPEFDK